MRARNGFRAGIGLVLLIAASLACNAPVSGSNPVPTAAATQATTVLFIAPENNSIIAEGTQITLAANAVDPGSGISKIEFRVDDNLIGTQTIPPGTVQTSFTARQPWTAKDVRGHFVSAMAYQVDGTPIGEAKITLTVVAAPETAAATEAPTLAGIVAIPTTAVVPTSTEGTTGATDTTSNTVAPPPTLFVASATSAQPAQPAASPTSNQPALVITYDHLNIRGGPGTNYPQIGMLKKGDTATIVGRNADRSWWVIVNGAVRGWVINQSIYFTITGDTAGVPLVAAPASPIPPVAAATATPQAAPTSTTGAVADLVFDSITLDPANPKAKQTFTVIVVIRNAGTVNAGTSLVHGVFQPGNEISDVPVPALTPGQSATVRIPVTLQSSGANQTGVITLDANQNINEGQAGEANNTRTITYTVS